MKINCPIHYDNHCITICNEIDTSSIIKLYEEQLNIDVSSSFKEYSKIFLCKCNKTGYKFYFPKEVQGNLTFYDSFKEKENYYLQWKWEYGEAKKWIAPNDSVLEIACGTADFLKSVSNSKNKCIGFDINASQFNESNLKIFTSNFDDFFKSNNDKFDVIVSFQFLEHIFDVKIFFDIVSNHLTQNGKLILGLPNNNSKIVKKEGVTNIPPHHMGCWTPKSIRKIAQKWGFNVKFQKTESLQPEHFVIYDKNLYNLFLRRKSKIKFIGKIINSIHYKLFICCYKLGLIKGHTFLTVLQKK